MAVAVDTNVLIRSQGKPFGETVFITPSISEELKSKEAKRNLEQTDYRVVEPSEKALEKVKELSARINSPTSETDEELVALALDRDLKLVSDDKPVQNLALHLDLEFEAFFDSGVEKRMCWKRLCSNCSSLVSEGSCARCGSDSIRLKQVRCSSK
ncbi:MAG: hypothetical protein ABEJ83_00035 [Candidatus Nanohaloarchaea archaeon]